jgi:hypothetical protein
MSLRMWWPPGTDRRMASRETPLRSFGASEPI